MRLVFFQLLTLIALGICLSLNTSVLHAQDAEPPANPIADLVNGIDRAIRQEQEELQRSNESKDSLDVRPTQRPEDNRRLNQAKELIVQEKWKDAVDVLQFLLDQPNDAFQFGEGQTFHSVQNSVDKMLQDLPPDALRFYITRFGVTAQQLLDQAMAEQDDLLLSHVATTYANTPAGKSAWKLLAKRSQDKGEFGAAADAFLRLMTGSSESEKNEILRSALWNLVQADRLEEAQKLVAAHSSQLTLPPRMAFKSPSYESRNSQRSFIPLADSVQLPGKLEPSLLPIWSSPLMERFSVASKIGPLVSDLREQGRALIPSIQPLAIHNKIAFRSLRSLQVRDVETGRLIWERRMKRSPEEQLTPPQLLNSSLSEEFQISQEALFEQHQLASLLYRDEVFGSLTSDGLRLYAVETSSDAVLTVPLQVWQMRSDDSAASPPWETNELTAFDLETGRIHWRVGGPEIEKQFSRQLAGTYFFGAPTPFENELYVIGERKGEVSLLCLSAQTGELLWSQALVEAGQSIREDLVRRQWACQPVIADGTILCTTGCGWIMAVDLLTHRLKWTNRYSPRQMENQQFRGGYSVQTLQELNRRWDKSIALVSGNRVIVTPPELPDEFGVNVPMLYCLDLLTGEKIWEQSKGDIAGEQDLYLAGIWNDLAIMVGNSRILARDIHRNGESIWTVPIAKMPSGRGLIANNKLFVPLVDETLLQLELRTQRAEGTTDDVQLVLPAVNAPLGNLTQTQGTLISVSYDQIAVFRLDAPSLDPSREPELVARTRLREARALLASRNFEQLSALLEQIATIPRLSKSLLNDARELQREMLTQKIKNDPETAARSLTELQKLVETDAHQRNYQRIRADFLYQVDDVSGALVAYLDILEQFPPNDQVKEDSRILRIDSWVGGRLDDLFEANAHAVLDRLLEEQITARRVKFDRDPVMKDRWARSLGFHLCGQKLEYELAVQSLADHKIAAGLLRLNRVIESPDPALKSQALFTLASKQAEIGWHQDALESWEQLSRLPSSPLQNGELSNELASQGISVAQTSLATQQSASAVWADKWRLKRVNSTGAEFASSAIYSVGSAYHGLKQLKFTKDLDAPRIRIEKLPAGDYVGSFPLKSFRSSDFNNNTGVTNEDSLSFVMHCGVLHAIGWPDQKMLWSWTPDIQGRALSRIAGVYPAYEHGINFVPGNMAVQRSSRPQNQNGYLLSPGSRALYLHCKDTIALDPLTGEELWRDSTPRERFRVQAIGQDSFLLTTLQTAEFQRMLDGKVTPSPVEQNNDVKVLFAIQDDLLTFQSSTKSAEGETVTQLQRITRDGTPVWTCQFARESLLSIPNERSILWINPLRELWLMNTSTGEKQQLCTLQDSGDPNTYRPVRVLIDSRGYYVLQDRGNGDSTYISLPAVRFQGRIIAFDRGGNLLWNYESPMVAATAQGPDQTASVETPNPDGAPKSWPFNILLDEFEENPLLLLVGDIPMEREDQYYNQLRIVAIDKLTGTPVIDWERPSESGGYSFMQINPAQKFIELRTFNERFLLQSDTRDEGTP
ncbi:PQQ-binding-like beta-propeller repeat protein [Planctomicrobium sp. SH668]|uniref:outer membrane protein assembly factor BamB family protein n=1 Tax=Planctomicrobium sp. SH668 TaxID=3448126 RepID=UPI003F5C5AEA